MAEKKPLQINLQRLQNKYLLAFCILEKRKRKNYFSVIPKGPIK